MKMKSWPYIRQFYQSFIWLECILMVFLEKREIACLPLLWFHWYLMSTNFSGFWCRVDPQNWSINVVLIESLATNLRILESKIFTKPTKIDVHKCSWNLILISQRSPAGTLQNELMVILNFVLNWTKASSGKRNILWFLTLIVSTWLIWYIAISDLPQSYSLIITTCIWNFFTTLHVHVFRTK